MIIFDYICSHCNIEDERYVKQDTKDSQLCYVCGNKMIRKQTFAGMVRGNFADKARVK